MSAAPTNLLALLRLCTLLGLIGLVGCAQPDDPVDRAQSFWDAVAAAHTDEARDQLITGDRGEQRERIEALAVATAVVEQLSVPPEAEVALLPTRIERSDIEVDGAPLMLDTLTVVRRTDAGWRVDLDATLREYRTAAADAVGERIADAAGRLADLLQEEGSRRAEELEAEIGRRLEDASEALARGLEELERALEEAQREEGR